MLKKDKLQKQKAKAKEQATETNSSIEAEIQNLETARDQFSYFTDYSAKRSLDKRISNLENKQDEIEYLEEGQKAAIDDINEKTAAINQLKTLANQTSDHGY